MRHKVFVFCNQSLSFVSMPVLLGYTAFLNLLKLPAPASDHCYDYCIFMLGFLYLYLAKISTARYGLFALQVLDCRDYLSLQINTFGEDLIPFV